MCKGARTNFTFVFLISKSDDEKARFIRTSVHNTGKQTFLAGKYGKRALYT